MSLRDPKPTSRGGASTGAAKRGAVPRTVSSRQTPDEVDHRRVDLGRPLLLGDMLAAGQHDRTAKLRHELRQVDDVPVHPGEFYEGIAIAGDVKRRHAHQ